MEYLSKKQFDFIKMISALIVVAHHCAFYYKGSLATFLSYIGYLPVSIFLFISGYGLMYSLQTRENYMKGFLRKHLRRLFFPAGLSLLPYLIYDHVTDKEISISSFFNGNCSIGHFWYVLVAALFYIIFFVICSITNSTRKIAVGILISTLLWIGLGYKGGLGSYWYYTSLAFLQE